MMRDDDDHALTNEQGSRWSVAKKVVKRREMTDGKFGGSTARESPGPGAPAKRNAPCESAWRMRIGHREST